jgi:hypothetical protein
MIITVVTCLLVMRGLLVVRGGPAPVAGEPADGGRWRHPDDDVLSAVVPWFEDPLDFLRSPGEMRRESWFLYEDGSADDPRDSALFHVVRGSAAGPGDLSWLDVEQAFNIAVNTRRGGAMTLPSPLTIAPARLIPVWLAATCGPAGIRLAGSSMSGGR